MNKICRIAMIGALCTMVGSQTIAIDKASVAPDKIELEASLLKASHVEAPFPSQTVLILHEGLSNVRVTIPYGSIYLKRTDRESSYPQGYIMTDGGVFEYHVTPNQVPVKGDPSVQYVLGMPYNRATNETLKKAVLESDTYKHPQFKELSSVGKYKQDGLNTTYWSYLHDDKEGITRSSISFALDTMPSVHYHMGIRAIAQYPIGMSLKSMLEVVSPSIRPASNIEDMASPMQWNDIHLYVPKGFVKESHDDLNGLVYSSEIGEEFSVCKMDITELKRVAPHIALKKLVPNMYLLNSLVIGELGVLYEEKAKPTVVSTVWNGASASVYVESERFQDGTTIRTMTSLFPVGNILYRIDYRYSIHSAPLSEQLMRDIVQTVWTEDSRYQREGYGVLFPAFKLQN